MATIYKLHFGAGMTFYTKGEAVKRTYLRFRDGSTFQSTDCRSLGQMRREIPGSSIIVETETRKVCVA